MKKINIYIYMLFLSLIVISCQDEEFKPVNNFSDVGWLNSADEKKGFNTEVGKYHSFSDLSQGALVHNWSFPNSSGINFLDGRITRQDTDYSQFIVEGDDTITTDKTIHLLFNKEGGHHIRLYNEFADSVTFRGDFKYPSHFNEEKGVYVIDTSFYVKVYGEIYPAVEVYHISDAGEETLILNLPSDSIVSEEDMELWDVFEFEAGEKIKFVDKTNTDGIGWPDFTTFILDGAHSKPDEIEERQRTGTYYGTGEFYSQVFLERKSDAGEYISGEKLSYLPIRLKVIPSSKPFGISGTPYELEDETIQIALTGQVKEFTGEEDNFVVTVDNDVLAAPITIPVAVAKRGDDESNVFIDLKLSQPIYNTDRITVSYSGGNIQSVDDRLLEDFTESVKMHVVNLTINRDLYSFENNIMYEGRGDNIGDAWNYAWNHINPNKPSDGTIGISSNYTSEGDYSMRVTSTGTGNGKWSWVESPLSLLLKSGTTYKYDFDYYVPSSENVSDPRVWYKLAPWSGPGEEFDMTSRDEWVNNSLVFTWNVADMAKGFILLRTGNGGNGDNEVVVYYDNFVLSEYEERPVVN